MIEEQDGSYITDYIYANHLPVGLLTSTTGTSGGTLYYVQADRQGTPQFVTNGSGTVVWKTTYQPYGTTGLITATLTTQNLRLPGQSLDVETGFYQNVRRDYMPNLGRYLEADPIGLAGGLNPYLYANANPGTFDDPSGLVGSITGPPNTWIQTSPGQWRFYDIDGNASVDIDAPHGHNPDFHAHNWVNGVRGSSDEFCPLP